MKAIFETVKLIARLAILAAISAFVSSVTEQVTNLPPNQTTVILGFILAGVDKWVHERKDIPAKGIVPF